MILNRIIKFIKSKTTPLEVQAKKIGVNIGSNNFVASEFWGTEPYLITIGNNCQITGGVKILTHGGGQVLRDKTPAFDSFGKVIIGDWVYIGYNSLIMPGVIIGDHVLVAAGSVVTKSIPSNCVVAGNPAKFICTIQDYEVNNKMYDVSTKGKDFLEKREILQSLSEDKFIRKNYLVIDK